MRGRTIEWEDEKQKSLVQHIVETSHKISMNAAGRGNSGIIFSPYSGSPVCRACLPGFCESFSGQLYNL